MPYKICWLHPQMQCPGGARIWTRGPPPSWSAHCLTLGLRTGFAGFSASASPSTDSGRSTTRPRDPQSTGIISMLTSPLSLLTNKRQGRPGSAAGPPPPGLAKANSSVQMPRGVAASPFDEPLDGAQQQQHASSLDPSTGRRSGKSGRSARGVLAAVGLASPFATEQSAGQSSPAAKPNTGNSLLSDPSTGALVPAAACHQPAGWDGLGSLPCSMIAATGQSLKADYGCFSNHLQGLKGSSLVAAGNTWDPSTQNTMSSGGGGEYDTIDLSSKLQERISNKSSGRSGRSVIISGESQKSAKSDLSRVSMAIQNELHGAEWKIERSTLTLGKRLGKGGFGAALLLPPSTPPVRRGLPYLTKDVQGCKSVCTDHKRLVSR